MAAKPKVHHLDCACIQGLSIHGQPLACHCLLIETPASGLVLVDTGLGAQDLVDPLPRFGFEFTHLYARPKRDPSLAAIEQIRKLGFDPRELRHIVLTHMDLDHVGGLVDFPQATVHLHATELKAAMERKGFKARRRYRPPFWAHKPAFQTYSEEGEPWFGFEAVRSLKGLPEEILLIPLFGHTLGHCGVAVEAGESWLLHAGDAYFDPREIDGDKRRCAFQVGLFQEIVQTKRAWRYHNQARLRRLRKERPEIGIFSAHNPFEFPRARDQVVPLSPAGTIPFEIEPARP
jgi:glyoxylase-like metal-dependent hydrolase (beta-lactamase superfamily II)